MAMQLQKKNNRIHNIKSNTRRKKKIKVIKSLLKNEHPCEYAIFLTEFLKE